MAFYDENEDDEQQEGQGPVALGAEAGVLGEGAAQAQGSSGGGSAPKKEPFVGISQYINANKPQSEKLANQVAGNIETKAQNADSALNSATNSFNQAADSQKVQGNDALFGEVQNNAVGVNSDANKKSQFETLRNASYSGPQDLQNLDSGNAWAGIQSALQKAKDAKAAANTESGRMGLIKEVSNNPRQSQGALLVDNLLLQSNPNAAGKLQQAGSSINSFDQRLSDANAASKAKSDEISANNASLAAGAKNALTSGYQNIYGAGAGSDNKYGTDDDVAMNIGGSLLDRVAGKTAAQNDAYLGLKQRIGQNSLTPEDLNYFGISPDTRLYGANLKDYLTSNVDANIKNVATNDDYAKLAALSALSGEGASVPDFLNPATDKNLVGTAGKGYNYDQQGLANKISERGNEYNQKYQQLLSDEMASVANPENVKAWHNWLLNGQKIPGWEDDALTDYARSVDGQRLIQLAKEYGYLDKAYDPGKVVGGMTGPLGRGV